MICLQRVSYTPEGGKRLLPLSKCPFLSHASCGNKRDRSAPLWEWLAIPGYSFLAQEKKYIPRGGNRSKRSRLVSAWDGAKVRKFSITAALFTFLKRENMLGLIFLSKLTKNPGTACAVPGFSDYSTTNIALMASTVTVSPAASGVTAPFAGFQISASVVP